MKLTQKTFLVTSIVAALIFPAFAGEEREGKGKHDEEKVEWDKVPAAVQSTITSNSGGGQVVSVEKETEKEGLVYEAKVKATDGKMSEVKVSADGKLIKVEADDEDEHEHGKDKDKDND